MELKAADHTHLTLPDYEVLAAIGEGGMSRVYKGRQRATGRLVAIKVIATEVAENFTAVERFEQEFRVGRKLSHPNIVQVLDFAREPPNPYLVMEYVEGQSLGRRVRQQGPLPEAEAVLLITQVAQALDYAHKRRVIHRDVKPDNILLTADGRAKLTDFGLVKDCIDDRHLTESMTVLGTAHFMAPEQYLDAKRVTARCDVYSLGATLYMAVTGKKPFESCRSLSAVMQQVARGSFTPPRELLPTLSETVDETIRQAMNPDPARRPASCLEFVKSLKKRRKRGPAAAAGPDGARPPGDAPKDGARRECRASVRYPYDLGTACGVETSVLECTTPDKDCWPAVVLDISRGGLALILGRRLEIDTTVVVDLQTPHAPAARSVPARVVHVRPHGSGHWRIGCELLEQLSPEQLQALL